MKIILGLSNGCTVPPCYVGHASLLVSSEFLAIGAKEINLAATVEHLRDQRPQMVKTKVWLGSTPIQHSLFTFSLLPQAQFEFALSALVAETQQMMDAAQKRPPMH